jgi:lipid-A-disaccharide synthase
MQLLQEESTLDALARNLNPHIFLSAGEASGDQYGAELILELRRRIPGATFFGLGGLKMAEAGQERVVRAEDVAHMGITEVIRHMPSVYARYRQLVDAIKAQRPAAAVLIDFPDVNFRLARELKNLGVPVVWFVSPQLWAWKRRRLRWVQERVDRMMVIFPFEEPFYRARGVKAEFVGHPLAEAEAHEPSREEYAAEAKKIAQDQWLYSIGLITRKGDEDFPPKAPLPEPEWAMPQEIGKIRYGLDSNKPWIALLPGSRSGEIFHNLPVLVEAAYQLGNQYEYLIPVSDTITEKHLNGIRYTLGDLYLRKSCPPRITLIHNARAALQHAQASVVASGTATVLAAVVGNPFVVVYRVSNMTYRVAKRLVRYPAEIPAQIDEAGNLPVGMVNLIAGRRVVPELLQERFTAENVVAALRPLLADGPERARMMADLAEIREQLQPGTETTAISKVAAAVEGLVAGVS